MPIVLLLVAAVLVLGQLQSVLVLGQPVRYRGMVSLVYLPDPVVLAHLDSDFHLHRECYVQVALRLR